MALAEPSILNVREMVGLDSGGRRKRAGLPATKVLPDPHQVFSACDALDELERHEFLTGIFQYSLSECGIRGILRARRCAVPPRRLVQRQRTAFRPG